MSVLAGYAITLGVAFVAVALIWYAKRLYNAAENVWKRLENVLVQRVGGEKGARAFREKFAEIRRVVEDAVYAVEQVSKNDKLTSEQKKQLALEQAKSLLKLVGLEDDVDDKVLGLMIEAAVFVMNTVLQSSPKRSDETKS